MSVSSRTARLRGWAATVALILACTPTEPCACPPARTSLIVYGLVRTATGAPAAGAMIRYTLAPPPAPALGRGQCAFDATFGDADPDHAIADADGRFRSVVYSGFGPAIRCLRVIAFASGGGADPDSARVEGVLVPFEYPEPDSVGLLLTLR